MAKPKRPGKKSTGKRAAKRAKVTPKPPRKAKAASSAKGAEPRARRETPSGEAIPAPEVSPSQIDTLVATIDGLPQMIGQGFESIETRLAWIPAAMAEMREEISSIRVILQQPPSSADRDVPTHVARDRRVLAGACKTLQMHRGTVGPTPAVIGRIMHDRAIFSPTENMPPRQLLQFVYSRGKHHLTDKIQNLLETFDRKGTSHTLHEGDEGSTSNSTDPKTKDSSKIAELLGKEFDTRFALLTNTGYGKREPVPQGKKRNYFRYLTPQGRALFDGWPEWTDRTGGISLADEPDSPSEPPIATEPDATATAPASPPPPPSPPPA